MAQLEDLPNELILKILNDMTIPNLINTLRSNKKLYNGFYNEFIGKINDYHIDIKIRILNIILLSGIISSNNCNLKLQIDKELFMSQYLDLLESLYEDGMNYYQGIDLEGDYDDIVERVTVKINDNFSSTLLNQVIFEYPTIYVYFNETLHDNNCIGLPFSGKSRNNITIDDLIQFCIIASKYTSFLFVTYDGIDEHGEPTISINKRVII